MRLRHLLITAFLATAALPAFSSPIDEGDAMTQIVEHVYRPRGAAAKLFTCRDPEVLLEGPAGTGKSRAVGEYLNYVAETYPGCRLLVLRKTRASLTESWMVTFEEQVLPPGHPVLTGIQRKNRHSYDYPNGSSIVLGGMDEKTRLFSTDYDIAYCNEANELTEDEFESLHRALRHWTLPYQQLVADCNPDAWGHWLNIRCNAGKTTRLITRHTDNPFLYDHAAKAWTKPKGEMYIKRLQALSGVRYKRLYLGQWCAAEGVVFEHFDPHKHFIDRGYLPPLRRAVAGVDWGFTNAGVLSVWSSDGDGRAYRVAEVYRTGQLLDWWIAQAQRLRDEFKIEVFRCDPSRPDYIAAFQNAGLNALEAENDITFGIDAIAHRLNVAADGKPRLYFVRDAVIGRDETLAEARQPWCTEQEMELYAWQPAREGLNAKEKPIDAHNHGIDATRYAINELDLGVAYGSATIEDTL